VMALVNQGGSLLLRNGALASGAGCCCSKCSGPCDEENPCGEGCVCVDGECVPADCCYCPAITFEYDRIGVDPFDAVTSWETEEEANAAAATIIGWGEDMLDAMNEAGYCSATMNVALQRVSSFFAFWLDPPRTLWALAQPGLLSISGGCCGTQGDGDLGGPKFPGTDFFAFGSVGPCNQLPTEEIQGMNCVPCSGCQGDPCCRPGVANPLP
jgi:hypothetical protein